MLLFMYATASTPITSFQCVHCTDANCSCSVSKCSSNIFRAEFMLFEHDSKLTQNDELAGGDERDACYCFIRLKVMNRKTGTFRQPKFFESYWYSSLFVCSLCIGMSECECDLYNGVMKLVAVSFQINFWLLFNFTQHRQTRRFSVYIVL